MASNAHGAPPTAGEAEHPSRTTHRLAVAVALILVLGLAAATVSSLIVSQANAGEHQEALEAQGDAIAASFEQRLDLAVRVLRTTRGLLRVEPAPTNERFQAFLRSATNTTTDAEGALRFDGFGGVTFIQWVRAAGAPAFIERKRREGFGDAFAGVPTGEDSYVFALHSSNDSYFTPFMEISPLGPSSNRRSVFHSPTGLVASSGLPVLSSVGGW